MSVNPEEQALMKDMDEQLKKLVPENSAPVEKITKKRKKSKAWIAG